MPFQDKLLFLAPTARFYNTCKHGVWYQPLRQRKRCFERFFFNPVHDFDLSKLSFKRFLDLHDLKDFKLYYKRLFFSLKFLKVNISDICHYLEVMDQKRFENSFLKHVFTVFQIFPIESRAKVTNHHFKSNVWSDICYLLWKLILRLKLI